MATLKEDKRLLQLGLICTLAGAATSLALHTIRSHNIEGNKTQTDIQSSGNIRARIISEGEHLQLMVNASELVNSLEKRFSRSSETSKDLHTLTTPGGISGNHILIFDFVQKPFIDQPIGFPNKELITPDGTINLRDFVFFDAKPSQSTTDKIFFLRQERAVLQATSALQVWEEMKTHIGETNVGFTMTSGIARYAYIRASRLALQNNLKDFPDRKGVWSGLPNTIESAVFSPGETTFSNTKELKEYYPSNIRGLDPTTQARADTFIEKHIKDEFKKLATFCLKLRMLDTKSDYGSFIKLFVPKLSFLDIRTAIDDDKLLQNYIAQRKEKLVETLRAFKEDPTSYLSFYQVYDYLICKAVINQPLDPSEQELVLAAYQLDRDDDQGMDHRRIDRIFSVLQALQHLRDNGDSRAGKILEQIK